MTRRPSDRLPTTLAKHNLLHVLEDWLMYDIPPDPAKTPMEIRRAFATITKRIRGDTQSAVHIEIDDTGDPYNFDVFWETYQKKVGRKDKLKAKWNKIPKAEREYIITSYLPRYIANTPEKRFRKNPETFLNNKSWNDEIISNNPNGTDERNAQFISDAASLIARIAGEANNNGD